MSDVMLHGVLKMPPNLWSDSPIDIAQRHGRYVEASKRIEQLEEDVANQRRLADLALAHRDEIIKERDTLELELSEMRERCEKLQEERNTLVRAFNSRGY